MGAQLTPEGVKFNGYDDVQTKPVNSVNGVTPNAQGEITIDVGGGGSVETLTETLFLDRTLHFTLDPTSRTYAYTGGTHDVPLFENFKTTHDDKHKLTFYTGNGYTEVLISDLINIEPTSGSPLFFMLDNDGSDGEWKMYFNGNHLVVESKVTGSANGCHRYAVYRIDMQSFATAPLDVYTKSEVDSLTSSSGVTSVNGQTGDVTISGLGTPQTLFLDTELCKFEHSFQGGSWFVYAKSGFTGSIQQYGIDYLEDNKVVIPAFEDFKINHADKHKLVFYTSDGNYEIRISDLIAVDPHEHPTNTNNWLHTTLFLKYDDDGGRDDILTLYFDGNDLVLIQANWGNVASSNRNFRVYRIEMYS